MKINGISGIDPVRAYNQAKKNKEEIIKDDVAPQSDSLEISREAKEMQFFKDALARMPGVREDMVQSLKQKIETGSYQPDVAKIADGMLEEILLDQEV